MTSRPLRHDPGHSGLVPIADLREYADAHLDDVTRAGQVGTERGGAGPAPAPHLSPPACEAA